MLIKFLCVSKAERREGERARRGREACHFAPSSVCALMTHLPPRSHVSPAEYPDRGLVHAHTLAAVFAAPHTTDENYCRKHPPGPSLAATEYVFLEVVQYCCYPCSHRVTIIPLVPLIGAELRLLAAPAPLWNRDASRPSRWRDSHFIEEGCAFRLLAYQLCYSPNQIWTHMEFSRLWSAN